ncbi:MAG: hypothetical protein SGCHY_002422 [Lobulomycetales sp.]
MEQKSPAQAVEEDFDELEEDQVFQIGSHMPSLLAQLDASTDLLLLKDIDSTILSTNDLRSKKLQAAMDTARALERSIASQRQSAERYHAKETRLQEHNAQMAQLERDRLADESACSDLRDSVSQLQFSLSRAQEALRSLDAQVEAESSLPPDETLLKLKLARGLGVSLIEAPVDGESSGLRRYVKAHVVSESRGQVANVDFDDARYSPFYYANLLWELCV